MNEAVQLIQENITEILAIVSTAIVTWILPNLFKIIKIIKDMTSKQKMLDLASKVTNDSMTAVSQQLKHVSGSVEVLVYKLNEAPNKVLDVIDKARTDIYKHTEDIVLQLTNQLEELKSTVKIQQRIIDDYINPEEKSDEHV